MGERVRVTDPRRDATTWRGLLASAVLLALIATLGAAPTSAGTPGDCVVRSGDGGRAYKRLQPAVSAARRGDRLTVRGTCRGTTVADRSLVIVGVRNQRLGRPILSGAGKVRVLRVERGVSVEVRSLAILRGSGLGPSAASSPAARRSSGRGGGIFNAGRLTLRDVEVGRNTASRSGRGGGGGVYNTGTLILKGATRISRNFSPHGGGVFNSGTLLMKGSSAISANGAESGGGVWNEGRMTMTGSSAIRTNGAEDAGGVTNLSTLVMRGSTTISGNTGGLRGPGGGVYNGRTGRLTMADTATIRGNTSVDTAGGGVANAGGSVRLGDEAAIHGNRAPSGGGLDTVGRGTVTLRESSSIFENAAEAGPGGGVSVRGGSFRMVGGATVRANNATQPGGGLSRASGTIGGVSCGPHTFANVFANTPDDCALGTP